MSQQLGRPSFANNAAAAVLAKAADFAPTPAGPTSRLGFASPSAYSRLPTEGGTVTQRHTAGRTGTRVYDDDDFQFNEHGATTVTHGKWPVLSVGYVLLVALVAVVIALIGTGVTSSFRPANADARALARRVNSVGDSLDTLTKALAAEAKANSKGVRLDKATRKEIELLKEQVANLAKAQKTSSTSSKSKSNTNSADAKELAALRNEMIARATADAKQFASLKQDVASLIESQKSDALEKKQKEKDEDAQDVAAQDLRIAVSGLKADVQELTSKVSRIASGKPSSNSGGAQPLDSKELASLEAQISAVSEKVNGLDDASFSDLRVEIASLKKRFTALETSVTLRMHEVEVSARQHVTSTLPSKPAHVNKVDYALFSGGGKVVGHSSLSPLVAKGEGPLTGVLKSVRGGVHPRADEWILSGGSVVVVPGECLAVDGASGSVDVRLREQIKVEAITIEHIHPDVAYDISSAPKGIKIWGWNSTKAPPGKGKKNAAVTLGTVRYQLGGEQVGAVQTFALADVDEKKFGKKTKNVSPAVDHVRFEITSNYGNKEWTCLYRLRVHGVPVAKARAVNYE